MKNTQKILFILLPLAVMLVLWILYTALSFEKIHQNRQEITYSDSIPTQNQRQPKQPIKEIIPIA